MLAPIAPLPAHLMNRGASTDLLKDEYLHIIKGAISNHPRSLQKRIGPSEIGHPCARRIGYKLLGHPELNHSPDDTPWLPTIGTAVHAWLEDVFTQANAGAPGGETRWLTELRVCVGTILGVDITGHVDLYDRVTATGVDWKIVGPTQLKKYRSQGPGAQYRGQGHLYGRGLTRRGLPVDTVAVMFMPRNGELRDAYLWTEPYDEQIALDALERCEGIALSAQTIGTAVLPMLGTADAYCTRCPYYRLGSVDPTTACPGDPSNRAMHDPNAPAFGFIKEEGTP